MYTIWHAFIALPPPEPFTGTLDLPLGARDGSESQFRAPADGMAQVKLSPEEMVQVTTWIDSMCQFYGSYWGRHHVKYRDRPDYRPVDSVDQALAPEPPSY